MDIQNLIRNLGFRSVAHIAFLRGELSRFIAGSDLQVWRLRERLGDILPFKQCEGYDPAFAEAFIAIIEEQSAELDELVSLYQSIVEFDDAHPSLARIAGRIESYACENGWDWYKTCRQFPIGSDLYWITFKRLKGLAGDQLNVWTMVYNLSVPDSDDRREAEAKIEAIVGDRPTAWIAYVTDLFEMSTDVELLGLRRIQPLILEAEEWGEIIDETSGTCIAAYGLSQVEREAESFDLWTAIYGDADGAPELQAFALAQVSSFNLPYQAWFEYLEGMDKVAINPMIRLAIERCAQLAPAEE